MQRFIVLFLFFLFFDEVSAQIVISESIENKKVSAILNDWSSKYTVDFAFDSYEISRYRYTGKLYEIPLDDALKKILNGTPFDFRWLNTTCVIYPKPIVNPTATTGKPLKRQLSGRVVDRLSGEALPFASVGAMKSGAGTTADADGKFILFYEGIQTTDTLAISALGYQLFRAAIDWDSPLVGTTFELVASEAILPGVEIEGRALKNIQQETLPGAFTILPNSSGLRSGVGEPDVFRLAQFAPGISGVQENSNGLFIRGSSSGQSQLLLDGFNVYHQDHFFGMFSSINAYAVKSMRLNKVLNDAAQGGRAAGSIELQGREGDLRQPSSRIEMGTMSVTGALETPLDSSGKAALFICGRRSITDFIKGPAYREIFRTLYAASIVSASGSEADAASRNFDPQLLFQDINAKLTFRPTFNHHINASFYASRDALSFNYADTSSAENVNVSDIRYSDESAKSNRGLSFRWSFQVSPRIEVLNSVGYSQFRGYYFSTDSIRNNLFAIDSTQFSFRDVALRDWSALHSWKWKSSNQELKWGIAWNYVATDNKQRSSEIAQSIESKASYTTTLFVGDEIRSARWLIHPALRLNLYSGKLYSEPRLSMRYELINSRLYLKAAATRTSQFVQRI
ncbi:MAG: carboxypeptidase-like regulatory domain-containing protein, partial [Flavobacteriales bacterium]